MQAIKKQEEKTDNGAIALPKTLCLIQITRMGDVIQTLMVAKELRQVHKDIRLILVARKQFAFALDFVLKEYFNKIYYMDFKSFLVEDNFDTSNAHLTNFLNELASENISVLANLSFSKSSSLLSSLIPATHKLGPFHGQDGTVRIADRWSKYIYSTVMSGPLNPFSLVDVYKKIIGVTSPSIYEGVGERKKREEQKGKNIIIHPFASHAKKFWKSNKWSEIIFKVLKDNVDASISLVGSEGEIALADKILENPLLKPFHNRINNLVGKTSMQQLFLIMEKSADLFVGHDSMVGHIASFFNVQTLTIALGTVRSLETIPYGENNFSISPKTKCFPCFPNDSCSYYQCHADIPFQIVASSISQIIKTERVCREVLEKEVSSFHLDSVNMHSTFFTDKGLLDFHSITANVMSLSDILKQLYRILWLYAFEECEEKRSFPVITANTHRELLHYFDGLKHLYELNEFGKKYSRFILEEIGSKTPSISKMRDFSAKIDEIDRLQNTIKEHYPGLAPFINYFNLVKGNLEGTNIVEIAENSFLAYHAHTSLVSGLYELMEKIVAEYKHTNFKNSIGTARAGA